MFHCGVVIMSYDAEYDGHRSVETDIYQYFTMTIILYSK